MSPKSMPPSRRDRRRRETGDDVVKLLVLPLVVARKLDRDGAVAAHGNIFSISATSAASSGLTLLG